MRAKTVVLGVLLSLYATVALADSISSISPSTIPYGSTEEFIAINGDGLEGSVSTLVVYDGGESVEPGVISPTHLEVWVPISVILVAGDHTVDVYATDTTGVRHIGPATLTVGQPVVQPGPPTISYPEIVVAEYAGPAGTPVVFDVEATHFDGTPVAVTCTPSSGSMFPMGTTTVNCTATDQLGSASASFPVIVSDTTPPLMTLPPDVTTSNPTVTFTATATDNRDGNVPVTCTPASGSVFLAGTTVVQCLAFDSSFNLTFGTFNVTVTANGAPALTVPEDFYASAMEPNGQTVTYDVSATGNAAVSCSPASGTFFPLGNTTVNCTATNAFGTANASFVVSVFDFTPPVLTLPDPTITTNSPSGAVVAYAASANDVVAGAVPIICAPASGTLFPVGVTLVDCSATDPSGNPAHGQFNVTVVLQTDTTPPIIHSVDASPSILWPPNHQMVNVTVTVVATDNEDPAPVSHIVKVSSNQPINGTGDGDTSPDWAITGPLTVNLRSERAGNKDRTYTITIETTDVTGNSSRATVKVKVTQSRRRAT